MLIKKILSLSNEITEGPQMIEDLIVILVILSLYLYEPKGGELANCLFNCCSSNHNSDAFFIVLEMTLSQVYSNELDISCKLSNQQIAIIFKSIFKWLIKSVSMFAIVGVKITIIENLCNSLSSCIKSNNQNNQNESVYELLQVFIEEVNNHRDDFNFDEEENLEENNVTEKDRSLNFDHNIKSNALKNNYINVEENETFNHAQRDRKYDDENEEGLIEEDETHPLKNKFIETFEEASKSTLKFKTAQLLNFVRNILCDSSITDPEMMFYLTTTEFARIVNILAHILKINEVDPLDIFDTFELLKPIKIFTENEFTDNISIKAKITLENFVESIIDVSEIGHHDILANYYQILNSLTIDLKKQEISKIISEIDFVEQKLDNISFNVHFRWLRMEILGKFFILKDVEPLIPLLVTCLSYESDEKQSTDEANLALESSNLLKLAFELFGEENTKRSIESLLIKSQKLYTFFFNWYYSQGFISHDQRPKTTNADFYPRSPNKKDYASVDEDPFDKPESDNDEKEDNFPLGDNYKVVESRPKTSLGILISKEKKDVNFDLSPSQTDSNEKHCLITKSNLDFNIDDDNNSRKPLAQFLTEEKQFETLASNPGKKESMLKSKEFEFLTAQDHETVSPRISEIHPENIQSRYEKPKRLESRDSEYKVEQEIIKQKITEERDILNREWESKFNYEKSEHNKAIKALEKANEYYANKASDAERLFDDLKEMKKLNEQLMEKYERTLQDNIERIKKEEEQKQKAQENIQNNKNEEISGGALLAFAKQNILNPMDLSMSLVIKEDSVQPQAVENPVIIKDHFNHLDKIFEIQRAILSENHDEINDSIINKDSVFKLQEYLIETNNPEEISKPLLLCYLKNKTSKEK